MPIGYLHAGHINIAPDHSHSGRDQFSQLLNADRQLPAEMADDRRNRRDRPGTSGFIIMKKEMEWHPMSGQGGRRSQPRLKVSAGRGGNPRGNRFHARAQTTHDLAESGGRIIGVLGVIHGDKPVQGVIAHHEPHLGVDLKSSVHDELRVIDNSVDERIPGTLFTAAIELSPDVR